VCHDCCRCTCVRSCVCEDWSLFPDWRTAAESATRSAVMPTLEQGRVRIRTHGYARFIRRAARYCITMDWNRVEWSGVDVDVDLDVVVDVVMDLIVGLVCCCFCCLVFQSMLCSFHFCATGPQKMRESDRQTDINIMNIFRECEPPARIHDQFSQNVSLLENNLTTSHQKASKRKQKRTITTTTSSHNMLCISVHKNKNNLQLNHLVYNYIHYISHHDAFGWLQSSHLLQILNIDIHQHMLCAPPFSFSDITSFGVF